MKCLHCSFKTIEIVQSFDLYWQLIEQFYTHIDHAFLIQSSITMMCVEVMSLPCIMIMYLTVLFHIPLRLYALNHSVKGKKRLQPMFYGISLRLNYFVRNIWHLYLELPLHGCNNFWLP
jgi:hypothetical protein